MKFYLFFLGVLTLGLLMVQACGKKVEPTGAISGSLATATAAATATVTATPTVFVCGSPTNLGFTAMAGGGTKTNDFITAFIVTFPSPVTVASLSAYIDSTGGGNTVLGLYADNSGTPGALLASGVINDVVSSWNTVAVTPVFCPAGHYWLALDNSSNTTALENSTGSVSNAQLSYTYNGTLPNPFGSGVGASPGLPYSMYATGCH